MGDVSDEHDHIFSVHISAKMSATVRSARIVVIGGQAVSFVTGLMCLAAAEVLRNGKEIPNGTSVDAIVLHAADEDRCLQWMDYVKCNFNCRKMWPTDYGPIVGTHAGPGTMAVAWFNSMVT